MSASMANPKARKPRLRDTKGRFRKATTPPLPSWYVPPIIQGRAAFLAEASNCLEAGQWIVLSDTRDV
jgi:hypothetical protein